MTTIVSTQYNNIARAISVYADAARADNALLLSSGIVGSDSRITDAGENYTGTLRWLSYTDPTTTHKPNETIADTDLNLLAVANQAEVYIKNVDAVAAQEASMQRLISKVDGLSYLGNQFGAVRARREDTQLRQVVRGVVDQVWGTTADLTADTDASPVNTFGYHTAYDATDGFSPLFTLSAGNAAQRSTFFDTLLDAMTAVSGEFEEPFYYMAVTPVVYNLLRKENVFDQDRVTDGNIEFNSILGGKIRLIVSGHANTFVGAGVQSGTNVSVLIAPGALAYSNVTINNPTAIDNNPLAANGGGSVTIVSRWGNIIHPRGYTWSGSAGAYPTNATLGLAASWSTTAANVNQTGIFPIFHG